jgi:hypothetical protein
VESRSRSGRLRRAGQLSAAGSARARRVCGRREIFLKKIFATTVKWIDRAQDFTILEFPVRGGGKNPAVAAKG